MMERIRSHHPRRSRPVLEVMEARQLLASLASIANLSVPAQQGYALALDGSGSTQAQTFSITRISGSPDITASIPQGEFWTINVQYTNSSDPGADFSGPLVFQLFQDLTPNTVSEIEQFTTDGYYTGKDFTRIASGFPGTTDDIIQGGAPDAYGAQSSGQPGTPFLNEIVQQLAFTGTDQLAMANAGVNTSLSDASQGVNTDDSQFFITTTGSPNSFLSYGYTIFGQMVSGQSTLAQMTQVPVGYNPDLGENSLPQPLGSLTMSSVSLSTTNPDGVALIDTTQARAGDTATFQVTATDPNGGTQSQQFTVTAGAYGGPTDPAVDFAPLASSATATVAEGSSASITLQGQAGYPDPGAPQTLTYSLVSPPSHGTVSDFDASTGTFVYTPQPGYSGTDSLQYQVQDNGPTPPLGVNRSTGQELFGPATTTTSAPATVAITVTPTSTSTTPTISWPNPAEITYGTPLGPAQLDATASVPGTFTYSPPPGTVLKAGAGQVLSVTFIPTDSVDYTNATAAVTIDVAGTSPTSTPVGPTPPAVTGIQDVTNRKHQVTQVNLVFSGTIDPAAAANKANYQLIKQGKRGTFVATRTSTIKIKSASFNPTDDTVTLIPQKPFALSKPVEVLVAGGPQAGLHHTLARALVASGRPGPYAAAILTRGGAATVAGSTPAAIADAVDILLAQSDSDGLVRTRTAARRTGRQ